MICRERGTDLALNPNTSYSSSKLLFWAFLCAIFTFKAVCIFEFVFVGSSLCGTRRWKRCSGQRISHKETGTSPLNNGPKARKPRPEWIKDFTRKSPVGWTKDECLLPDCDLLGLGDLEEYVVWDFYPAYDLTYLLRGRKVRTKVKIPTGFGLYLHRRSEAVDVRRSHTQAVLNRLLLTLAMPSYHNITAL